jgi:aminodeoxyfutalosine deaminase
MVRDLFRRLRRPRSPEPPPREGPPAPPPPGAPTVPAELERYLLRLPKSELHVHLEGSLRPATLLDLAGKHAVLLPASDEPGLRRWFRRTASDAVEATCRRVLMTPEDFHLALLGLIAEHAVQNVRYAEVRISLAAALARGVPPGELRSALAEATAEARKRYRLRLRLLVALHRENGVEGAGPSLAWAQEGGSELVAGVALAGPPTDGDAAFEPLLRAAAEGGLGRVVEVDGGASSAMIRLAVEELGAQRLGHGGRAATDAAAASWLAERGTPVTLCPAEDIRELGSQGAGSVRDRLRGAGIPHSLHSGRPQILCTNLSREYLRVAVAESLGRRELAALAAAAFQQAFLPAGEGEALWREAVGEAEGLR